MMKEGRGRSSNGGAIELTKEFGDLNLQVNAMVKDGTSLFDHSRYHKLQKDKKSFTYVPSYPTEIMIYQQL